MSEPLYVQICVGSSCHLRGSADIVERMPQLLKEHDLESEIILMGSFCTGKCNREGVTIQVNDDIYPGVTPEKLDAFFAKEILARVGKEG